LYESLCILFDYSKVTAPA